MSLDINFFVMIKSAMNRHELFTRAVVWLCDMIAHVVEQAQNFSVGKILMLRLGFSS